MASAVYKLYCVLLNERLNKWVEVNGILSDCQNGFRKHIGTTDHLSSLTCLIETLKLQKISTFVCFIDFRKAYDKVNRNLTWEKLFHLGITGKMYSNHTDWFNVNSGLKLGCLLSPKLFNLFVNDITMALKASGYGVDIDGGTKVSDLQYAGDISYNSRDARATTKHVGHTTCIIGATCM